MKKEIINRLRHPFILTLIAILLVASKSCCNDEYLKVVKFVNTIDKLEIINLLSPITVLLFMCSVITSALLILAKIIDWILFKINDSKKIYSRRSGNLCNEANKFFCGIKLANSKLNDWLVVASLYHYLFQSVEFKSKINYLYMLNCQNEIIIPVTIVYICILLNNTAQFVKAMIYRFFYFDPKISRKDKDNGKDRDSIH